MTPFGFFFRGACCFSLIEAHHIAEPSLNFASFFIYIGSIFFAGIFCLGKSNRYLVITMISVIVAGVFVLILSDAYVYESAYIRIWICPLISFVSYRILLYRNVLTMNINRHVNREFKDGIPSFMSRFIRRFFKRGLPARETNMSFMIISYCRLYLGVEMAYAIFCSLYLPFAGVGINEMATPLIDSGQIFDITILREMAIIVLDFFFSVSLVTHAIFDCKRPDSLGVGRTATYDTIRFTELGFKN